jgi:hypothetical protein
LYAVSQLQRDESRAAQELIERHIATLTKLGRKVIERARRDKCTSIARKLHDSRPSSTDNLSASNTEDSPISLSRRNKVNSSEHVIGFEDLVACEREIDNFEVDPDDKPITIDEDDSVSPARQPSDPGPVSGSGRSISHGASELVTENSGVGLPQPKSTQSTSSTSGTSAWLSSLASKTFGAGTNVAAATVQQPNLASTLNNSGVMSTVFKEDEDEEDEEKEDLKELDDYYSSFLQRKSSKESADTDATTLQRRFSLEEEQVVSNGTEVNVTLLERSPKAQTQQEGSVSANRSRPSVPSLLMSSSSRGLGMGSASNISPGIVAYSPSVPPPVTPNKPSSVGGFFSGLLGSTAGSATQSADGSIAMFTDRSLKVPVADSIIGEWGCVH